MGIMLVVILLVLIVAGLPVAFALGISGLVYFFQSGIGLETFAQRIAVGMDSFALLAAPFFILAGNIMNRGGITNRIFRFANSLVGHLRGGLGHVNILASMLFAGMSGTAIADAAGLGSIEIKAMQDEGYDLEFSTAVTAASSIIGPIIPPSTVMVLFGVTAGVSIGQLFMGGILPGILIGLALMLLVMWYSRKRNYPKKDRFEIREVVKSFCDTGWALVTPILIVGGILGGICTPTEAGTIAVVYALFISVFVYKEIKLKDIPSILWETAKTSGVILVIVATASTFGWCLTYEHIPQSIAESLSGVTESRLLLMAIMAVIYLFLGMIMETSAIILTTVPIFVPVLKAMGIDLVYFGVFLAILMSIGTITPPVGTVLFILSKITGLPINKLSRIMLPWYGVLGIVVILLLLFPPIITFLPGIL